VLFDLDAHELRAADPERYLELSRVVSGEVMAEVFGEWRRSGSRCGGGLVLWLRDLQAGAGWGVIDHRGVPKPAYHQLARALAPVAVWTIDEGLGGIVAHVANDRPEPLSASLRVALYRGGELCVEQASAPVALGAHSGGAWNVESVIGHFVDAAWAYRFGPPAQDAIVVSLEHEHERTSEHEHEHERTSEHEHEGEHRHELDGARVISQAVRFPAKRPLERESPEQLGLAVRYSALSAAGVRLVLSSRRLAYGVRIDAPGFVASDDGFFIEPGGVRTVTLRPCEEAADPEKLRVRALNMRGALELTLPEPASGAQASP
jgi:beta-mannosidase